MVDLGDGAEADQVLDEAGEGGDVCHAAEDGGRARMKQLAQVVPVHATILSWPYVALCQSLSHSIINA